MSVSVVGIATAVTAGAAVYSAYSASKAASTANDTNQQAIAANETAAQQQQRLAQEQWDFQKNTYLPKQMAQADQQQSNSNALTTQQIANSNYDMDLSKTQNAQARKSYAYQDQYDQLTNDYTSGKAENVQANLANANVEQAYTNATGSLQRSQSRMGINPGSGASAAAAGDMYTQKMLAGAGAQTSAQQAARTKAETMVAVAAGAGNAGFGTGAASGALANGAINGAAYTNNTSLNGMNSVANTYGYGLSSAAGSLARSGSSWNNAVGTANNYAPWTQAASGIAGLASSFGGGSGGYTSLPASIRGGLGTAGAYMNGSYNANYGNEGLNAPPPPP